jgi:hypothetical protein
LIHVEAHRHREVHDPPGQETIMTDEGQARPEQNDEAGAEAPRPENETSEADKIDKDDPHKVEKLSKLGHAGEEAAEGTE